MENEVLKGDIYELGLHLVSDINPEEVPARFGDIKNALENMGAMVISEEMPKELELAYEMRAVIENKVQYFTRSYFGWVKFELSADKIAEVKNMMDSRNDIIRMLLVSTVRENTLSPRKLFEKKEGSSRRKKEEKETMPMDTEAVDAELDKILVEEPADDSIDQAVEKAI